MVGFLSGVIVGGVAMFLILLVYGLCTVSRRSDDEAEIADRKREMDKPDPKPEPRKAQAIFLRGDETILN